MEPHRPATLSRRVSPSLLSVCEFARHHPLAHRHPPHCLARGVRRGFLPFLLHQSTLIRLRLFNHRLIQLAGTGIPLPAATSVARLTMIFTRRVTLVGTKVPRSCQVCPRLPPRHSFRPSLSAAYFGGQNTEASPLPTRHALPDSAPSLCMFTGKDFMSLS